jgi:hypothetical protein
LAHKAATERGGKRGGYRAAALAATSLV